MTSGKPAHMHKKVLNSVVTMLLELTEGSDWMPEYRN